MKKLTDLSQTKMKFRQIDATRLNEPDKIISIDDDLQLDVEPSGVRVVTLEWQLAWVKQNLKQITMI